MIKTAVVTGAAGGLGLKVVAELKKLNFRVIAIDIIPSSFPDSPGTGTVDFIQANVTDQERIHQIAQQTGIISGGLDLLVCLAGVYDTYPVTETDTRKMQMMLEVNFLSVANMIRACINPLVRNHGRVVVVSSESYKIQAMFQPYMISKSALESYCRVAWQELALKGVSLIVIRPGAIDTPLLRWQHAVPTLKDSIFAREFEAGYAESLKLVGNVTSATKVAEVILRSATSKKPKRYYKVNNNPLLTLISFLPSRWLDALIVWRIRKKSGTYPASG